MPVNPNNPVTKEGIMLGRRLFYDPILSVDSSISCSSCHIQKFAFSGGPVKLNNGIKGRQGERNTPALFNLAWSDKLFWDGRAENIETQVFHPIRDQNEMAFNWNRAEYRINNHKGYSEKFKEIFGVEKVDSSLIANVIAQFERTLVSHNSKVDQAARGEIHLTDKELIGFELMNNQVKGNCLHCHTTDNNLLGTTGKFSNNGLDRANSTRDFTDPGLGGVTKKREDYGKFKIPSLRNLVFTAPYMHDGRFRTLREVLEFYNSGVQHSFSIDPKMEQVHESHKRLTTSDIDAIIAFLEALSDSSFVTAKRFSNPNLN